MILLSVLLLDGCAVKPPDSPLCVEITPTRGSCTKIISGESFDVDDDHKFEDKTWWEHRPAMILMPASTWKELKTYIIKMCKKTNMCDKEITNWERTVDQLDNKIQEKIP